MPPTDQKHRGQLRVDEIFQAAKEAQRAATKDALAVAFRGDTTEPEPANRQSGPTEIADGKTPSQN